MPGTVSALSLFWTREAMWPSSRETMRRLLLTGSNGKDPGGLLLVLRYKYDTNVIAKGSGPLTDSITGQEDSALNFSVRVGYTAPFSFRTPFSFSGYYSLSADRYFGKHLYPVRWQPEEVSPSIII